MARSKPASVSGKLLAWLALVGAQIVLNYASRASGGKPDRNAVYHWSTVGGALLFYAVFFGLVLAISREQTRELLALRRPRSWSQAAGVALVVTIGVIVFELLLEPFLHANREQGLTPKHWEPAHAGTFAASFVVLCFVGPFVEEATFRGLGFSLIAPYGEVLAIIATGVLFGLAHGLVEALPVLVALGLGLAYLRARSDSLYPGFVVHAFFNALALTLAVA
jgi:membrane protease YdiL (CAAX protease family)